MEGQQLSEMINGMLKPSVVEQLIQEYAAPSIVKAENIPVVGTRQDLVSGLIAYGGRDVKVTDEELRAAYQERQQQFQTPASAAVSEATFPSREQALAFRQDWQGGDFTAAATRAGAVVSERGTVQPDTELLEPAATQAIFEGELRPAGDSSLTGVVQAGDGWKVMAVSDLQASRVLPLDEVQATLKSSLFNEKQAAEGEKFLSSKVAALKPVNKLEEVLAAQKARVGADAPADASGAQTTSETQTTSGTQTAPQGASGAAGVVVDDASGAAATSEAQTAPAQASGAASEGSAAAATPAQ